MKSKNRIYWVKTLFLALLASSAWAQEEALFAVGQTKLAELQMKVYPNDSTADGVILEDRGTCALIKDDARGYMTVYRRYTRIKILKKSAFSYATVEVPFYDLGTNQREQVRDITARTYNLNNDAFAFTTLEKNAVFEEKKTDKVYLTKFAMPNVREGSVIEYSYTIESDLVFQLRDWEFQMALPTVRSNFWLTLIPNFEYRILFQSIRKFSTDETSDVAGGICYHWGLEQIPALRDEPFITTLEDYRAKIWFELVATNLQGEKRRYAQKWEDLDRTLALDDSFGKALNKSNFLKETAQNLSNTDTLKRAQAAYQWVRTNMNWDGRSTWWTTKSLKDAYEKRTGSAADLNLMLVALLREMQLDANPVVLSTRSNGKFSKDFPLLSKFNYVVAHLNLNGQDILLDATDHLRPFGMLPFNCLSQEGRLIAGQKSRWVPLKPTERRTKVVSATVELLPNGQLKGQASNSMGGYAAWDVRQQIAQLNLESYRTKLSKNEGQLENIDIKNADQPDQRLVISYANTLGEAQEASRFYVNPLVDGRINANPFKKMARTFVIDFGVPVEEIITVSMAIPAGFVVEELPKNAALSLPNNAGRFLYAAQTSGNTVQVTSRLVIRNTLFEPEQYDVLRAFYDQIIAKHGELVVITKK